MYDWLGCLISSCEGCTLVFKSGLLTSKMSFVPYLSGIGDPLWFPIKALEIQQ